MPATSSPATSDKQAISCLSRILFNEDGVSLRTLFVPYSSTVTVSKSWVKKHGAETQQPGNQAIVQARIGDAVWPLTASVDFLDDGIDLVVGTQSLKSNARRLTCQDSKVIFITRRWIWELVPQDPRAPTNVFKRVRERQRVTRSTRKARLECQTRRFAKKRGTAPASKARRPLVKTRPRVYSASSLNKQLKKVAFTGPAHKPSLNGRIGLRTAQPSMAK